MTLEELRRAVLRHWEKACSVATLGEGVQCYDTGRRRASVATLGEGAQCCDTGRRRAVLRHWEKACSVATLGEGVQCCDTVTLDDVIVMIFTQRLVS